VLGKQTGILTARQIDDLIDRGVVVPSTPLEAAQRQPTTLDLRLGSEAIATRAGLLAQHGTVRESLADLAGERLDLTSGAVLRRGQIYLIRLQEDLALPTDLRARANPRSSTGRIDVFTRTLVDNHDRFDDIPAGYEGPLWLEVLPRSFDIKVQAGQRLNQLRFLRGRPLLRDDELSARVAADDLLGGGAPRAIDDASLLLGLSLRPERHGEPIAWRARSDAPLLDLSRPGSHAPGDFFDPIYRNGSERLVLEPEAFYILASDHRLRVPPDLAAEMLAYDVGMGELRTNYAGFFDPGFGWGADSRLGARAVLEVRAHDVAFRVEHGQPLFRLQFSHTVEPCEHLYGGPGSAYQNQGLTLSRYFAAS